MKKKGFTLIGILGVIVVIAIIAVITIPIISGIITKARKASYKDSVYGMIESANLYLASNISSIGEKEIEFVCDGTSCKRENGDKLNFKGSVPKSGSIYIKGNDILIESVYNGKYYANNETGEVVITGEDSTLTRGELTDLVKELQKQNEKQQVEINQLKNQHNGDMTNVQNQINNLKNNTTNIDEIYPVGSIYITTSNVNPSSLFKDTTWERYGVGKTLVSTDSTSGETGGSNNATLSIVNLPAHSHTVTSSGSVSSIFTGSTVNSGSTGNGYSIGYTSSTKNTSNTGAHTHDVVSPNHYWGNDWGGGEAFSAYSSLSHAFELYGTAKSAGNHSHTVSDSYANSISGVEAHTHSITAKGTVSSTFTGSSVTTSSVGNGISFSVQNPYITVYMWKRIS